MDFQPFNLLFPHQIFKERCDLSGEHGQIEEAGGDLVIILGQVAVPQVLQNLDILFFVFHMGWKKKKKHTQAKWALAEKSLEMRCADSLKDRALERWD